MTNSQIIVFDSHKVLPSLALVRFNLAWHTHVMKDILLRYKILILFIVLMLAPTLTALKSIVLFLTINLVAVHSEYYGYFISLMAYQAFGLLWFLVQQAAFANQPWHGYLLCLPLTKKQISISEILILLIIDIVLWLPLLVASCFELALNINNESNSSLIIAKTLANIILILLIQSAYKRKKYILFLWVVICDVVLIYLNNVSHTILQISATILIMITLMLAINWAFDIKLKIKESSIFCFNNKKRKITINKSFLPFMNIQVKNLIASNFAHLILPLLFLLISSLLVFAFVRNYPENKNLYFIISILTLMNGLAVSNLFSRFHIQRIQYQSYFASLPISKIKLFYYDFLVASLVLAVFNLAPILMTVIMTAANYKTLLIIFFNPIIFLAFTYFPQIKYKRYGMFISLLFMFSYVWINYLLLNSSG